jgi:hypothetical protein
MGAGQKEYQRATSHSARPTNLAAKTSRTFARRGVEPAVLADRFSLVARDLRPIRKSAGATLLGTSRHSDGGQTASGEQVQRLVSHAARQVNGMGQASSGAPETTLWSPWVHRFPAVVSGAGDAGTRSPNAEACLNARRLQEDLS